MLHNLQGVHLCKHAFLVVKYNYNNLLPPSHLVGGYYYTQQHSRIDARCSKVVLFIEVRVCVSACMCVCVCMCDMYCGGRAV